MAEFSADKTRAVAIELREQIISLYTAVSGLYYGVVGWNVRCDWARLPAPFDVKVQVDAYKALKIAPLQLTTWGAELQAATYGDTLQALPPCDPIPDSDTGGIIFPTPGLTISQAGIYIPAFGLTMNRGISIPSTGISIPS
jgi:hypothetical protein